MSHDPKDPNIEALRHYKVKEEGTGERPSIFSGFHRNQTKSYMSMTDIDWLIYSRARGELHPDTFVGTQRDGAKVIYHASFDEKNPSTELPEAKLKSMVSENSIKVQSALPWPFYLLIISEMTIIVIAQNQRATDQLAYIESELKYDRNFNFIPDLIPDGNACMMTDPALPNPAVLSKTWTLFEDTLRNYVYRHLDS